VEVEILKIAVESSLVEKKSRKCCGEMSLSIGPSVGCSYSYAQHHKKGREFAERSVSGGRKRRCWQCLWGIES